MASMRRLLGFPAMTLVTLVVAHNLVFFLAYGSRYDEALARTGHGEVWGTAVAVVITTALVLVGLAAWRLFRLGMLARSLGPGGDAPPFGSGAFARGLARLWVPLAAATTVLFVVQENLEHQSAGAGLPGLSVLGSAEYPHAGLVIGAIALAVAAVAALFRWQRDVLMARITRASRLRQRAARLLQRRRADWVELRHASIVVHQFPGRAPPQLSTL